MKLHSTLKQFAIYGISIEERGRFLIFIIANNRLPSINRYLKRKISLLNFKGQFQCSYYSQSRVNQTDSKACDCYCDIS